MSLVTFYVGDRSSANHWRRYSVYKDSGVEWLGEIPRHWEVKRVKWITETHKQGYYTDKHYIDKGVKLARITDIDDFGNVSFESMPFVDISAKDEQSFQLQEGDFLFARSGTIGRFGVVQNPERSVFASYLIRFRFSNVEPKFLAFAFSSHFFKESLISTLHGGANQNVHAENIKEQLLTIPPLDEQRAIASFLDKETFRIDKLVEKKEKLVKLLQEKRTALISHAVTKGLDATVAMKDSGIEWLGEIPRHWEVKKLNSIVSIILSGVDKKTSKDEQKVLLCNYVDVYYNDFISSKIKFLKATATQNEIRRCRVEIDDVLITKDSETPDDIAVPALVVEKANNLLCGYHLSILRPFPDKIDGLYLLFAIKSLGVKAQFSMSAQGITRFGLTYNSIKNVNIPIPPLPEQKAIASYLDKETKKLDDLIAKIRKSIETQKEYRTALISAAVTGKIDVSKN